MRRVKIVLGFCLSFCMMLVLTACGSSNEEVLTCTLKQDVGNYELESTYKAYHVNGIVNRVETIEVVSSDDSSILSAFETTLNASYKTMNNLYGGYKYSVTINGNKLTAKADIDYTELDLDKLIKADSSMKSIVNNDNKITLDGVRTLYEQLGAKCK